MIASVRGKARGDRSSRRRTPIRLGASLLAAAAFLFAANTVMAATTSATVLDQGMDVPAVTDTTATPTVDVTPRRSGAGRSGPCAGHDGHAARRDAHTGR